MLARRLPLLGVRATSKSLPCQPRRLFTSRLLLSHPALISSPWRTFASEAREEAGKRAPLATNSLVITDRAKERLRALRRESGDIYLRIVVDSGGCNGYLARFQLDQSPLQKDDIKVLDDNGAVVVLDRLSEALVRGATIDYESSLARSAFIIAENPNATSQCGCKVSFGV